MTDHDELEALRHQLFGPPNPNPARSSRITLDHVIEFSRDWQRSRGRFDAEVRTDPDGNPISVGDSFTVQCAGLVISQADADRLGIKPNTYPGIKIFPNTKGKP